MSKVQLWQIIPEYRNIHFVGRDLQPVVKVIKKFPFYDITKWEGLRCCK